MPIAAHASLPFQDPPDRAQARLILAAQSATRKAGRPYADSLAALLPSCAPPACETPYRC